MFTLSFMLPASPGGSFFTLIHENPWLFIPAFVVLAFSMLLLMGKVFAAQVLLLTGIFAAWNLESNALFIGMMALQLALAIWLVVRLITDIEWSYSRRLEKTHFLPRSITKGGNAGIRHYRF